MFNPFFKEGPSATPMLPCPSCHEIINVSSTSCRYCGTQIDEATARRLNNEFQRVTDAVASANTFKQSLWVAVLSAIAVPILLILTLEQNPAFFVVPMLPVGFIAYALSWRRKYGSLETRDEDYPGAVRSMRLTLIVWVVAGVIQAGFVGYVLFFGVPVLR
jgi:hypothetical protein